MHSLANKKVAILVTDGFEQVEMIRPREALREAGAEVHLVGLKEGKVRGMHHHDHGDAFNTDTLVGETTAEQYDALVLPGGVINPDALRTSDDAVGFVRDFFTQGKPVAAICHGAWTLVEADVLKGRTLTSWPSLKTDIQNAGGEWVDREVIVDHGLITSRNPDDLDAFCTAMVEEFQHAKPEGQHA